MEQEKRAAGVTTGSPSMRSNSLPHSFAPIGDIRQAILSVARIEDHAARSGFRRGRGGRWHCGVHIDRNPSCTVRDGRIRCWVCDEAWNVIDLEMLTTGEPFMRALRALASEYGIRMACEAHNPSVAKQRAREWRESQERAFNWRAGFLDLADDILAGEKAKLFDPAGGPTNESLILSLSRAERIIREAQSNRFLVRIFEIFSQVMPGLATALADYGDCLRFERQAMLAAFVELLAEAEERW